MTYFLKQGNIYSVSKKEALDLHEILPTGNYVVKKNDISGQFYLEGIDRFEFKGKSGRVWRLRLRDRRIAKVIRACQELPGQQLFQYIDDDGERRGVSSTDVNAYLREIAGCEVTAKDFRTWAGTVMAALALGQVGPFTSPTDSKRKIRAAIDAVATKLGNTPTICRKCYVHPSILEGYLSGRLAKEIRVDGGVAPSDGLLAEEAAVLSYLSRAAAHPTVRKTFSAAA